MIKKKKKKKRLFYQSTKKMALMALMAPLQLTRSSAPLCLSFPCNPDPGFGPTAHQCPANQHSFFPSPRPRAHQPPSIPCSPMAHMRGPSPPTTQPTYSSPPESRMGFLQHTWPVKHPDNIEFSAAYQSYLARN